jgi:hypothetical protein
MKALLIISALGLSLIGSSSAQQYDGHWFRDRADREHGRAYRERGRRYSDREDAFDESEYLRCMTACPRMYARYPIRQHGVFVTAVSGGESKTRVPWRRVQ